MEGEHYLMRRVFFLRWYFGFQLNCNVCVLNALFVSTPLSGPGPYWRTEFVLVDPNRRHYALKLLHCLWGPATYLYIDRDESYYQQGKLHRSDGPALTRRVYDGFRALPQEDYSKATSSFDGPPGQQVKLMHLFYKEGVQVEPF